MPLSEGGNFASNIYHEKQVRELCALHAINNILQRRQFTERQLHAICERLSPGSWVNPHRSLLGTGNFDVNVLLTALHHVGLEGNWFDRRRPVSSLVLENIEGFILNQLTEYHLGPFTLPYSRRHWVAMRRLPAAPTSSEEYAYYNLDSKLALPLRIGSEVELVEYLTQKLSASSDVELFVVVSQQVAEAGTWINPLAGTNACQTLPSSAGEVDLKCEEVSTDGSLMQVKEEGLNGLNDNKAGKLRDSRDSS